jgi:hypothetical protein
MIEPMYSRDPHDDSLREGEPPVLAGRSGFAPLHSRADRPSPKILRVRATGTGRIVLWTALKKGRLVDCSRWHGMTTTLPDVITDLCETAQLLDADFLVNTIVPNGPTSAALDLHIAGVGFDIVCARRLVRGLFPINFLAAEFGGNYDVVVTLLAESEAIETRFLRMLLSKYACTWSDGTRALE